jgi:hypothetical protein
VAGFIFSAFGIQFSAFSELVVSLVIEVTEEINGEMEIAFLQGLKPRLRISRVRLCTG